MIGTSLIMIGTSLIMIGTSLIMIGTSLIMTDSCLITSCCPVVSPEFTFTVISFEIYVLLIFNLKHVHYPTHHLPFELLFILRYILLSHVQCIIQRNG